VVEDDHLAGHDVGRDRPKRHRQVVEALDVDDAQRQRLEREVELLAGNQAARQAQLAVREPELERRQVGEVVDLAAERQLPARRTVLEHLGPVGRDQHLFDLGGRHPGRVEAAGDRPRAGAGNAVDRDSQLLERLEHPDVRGAERPAARQHEGDPWPAGDRGRGARRRVREHRPDAGQGERSGRGKQLHRPIG
jgi:hypothetical protein